MIFDQVVIIGAFIRWLFKGGKTSLKEELKCTYPATWGKDYEIESAIIGYISAIIIIGLSIWLFFY